MIIDLNHTISFFISLFVCGTYLILCSEYPRYGVESIWICVLKLWGFPVVYLISHFTFHFIINSLFG